jgi:hypothetical protein
MSVPINVQYELCQILAEARLERTWGDVVITLRDGVPTLIKKTTQQKVLLESVEEYFIGASNHDSIRWSWPDVEFSRHGELISIPKGNLTITDLKPDTLYYFYPYWNAASCKVQWLTFDCGRPEIATANDDVNCLMKRVEQYQDMITIVPLSPAGLCYRTKPTAPRLGLN